MIKSFKSFQSLRYPICFGICRRHEIWCIDPASTLFQDFLVFFARPLFMYYSIPYYHDSKSHQVWTSHLLVTFYIWKTLLETLLALSGKKAREGTVSDFFVWLPTFVWVVDTDSTDREWRTMISSTLSNTINRRRTRDNSDRVRMATVRGKVTWKRCSRRKKRNRY